MTQVDGFEDTAGALLGLIENKTAVIGVIGLGYVGPPLISTFTNAGFRCRGFDVDQKKVDSLAGGRSYIKHVDSATVADWIQRDGADP